METTGKTRRGRVRRDFRYAAALVCAVLLCSCACVGCSQAKVGEGSPHVDDVQLKAMSDMTESSQSVEIRVSFDRPVSAAKSVADDFRVLLNGAELDGGAVALDVRTSADAVTFVLHPAPEATGLGKGSYFALYQCGFSIESVRSDGALPSITGADGACAVLDDPIEGTLPSGLALETLSARAGSTADNQAAQTVIRVSSPALVRAITWFSPDGGTTKLLKHNHTFADADASECAADLANIVNKASGLGLTATAHGDQITLTATSVNNDQVIEPIIVEGTGVEGGAYDPSQGTGEGV